MNERDPSYRYKYVPAVLLVATLALLTRHLAIQPKKRPHNRIQRSPHPPPTRALSQLLIIILIGQPHNSRRSIATLNRCDTSASNPARNALVALVLSDAGIDGVAVIYGCAWPNRFQLIVNVIVRRHRVCCST